MVENLPAVQGTRVGSLVWEDPTRLEATKPIPYNDRSLHALEPVLCNKRRHRNEKPTRHN